jgi:hypothetical protein
VHGLYLLQDSYFSQESHALPADQYTGDVAKPIEPFGSAWSKIHRLKDFNRTAKYNRKYQANQNKAQPVCIVSFGILPKIKNQHSG